MLTVKRSEGDCVHNKLYCVKSLFWYWRMLLTSVLCWMWKLWISQELLPYVCQAFVVIDASDVEMIRKSSLSAGVVAELILNSQIANTDFACGNREIMAAYTYHRVICNVLLNKKRKRKLFPLWETKSRHLSDWKGKSL